MLENVNGIVKVNQNSRYVVFLFDSYEMDRKMLQDKFVKGESTWYTDAKGTGDDGKSFYRIAQDGEWIEAEYVDFIQMDN
ncbi:MULTISPECIES: hypothetical protein [Companilactobacillus]|uniref:Uncharacterized protein n=1 Tax=Companilactobacillus nodensis DSM 19682 = JCM 14932 = NBRC 107160 TaxID=1423775 RepID=A0A0R1K6C2_9LACO|nr:MULTISPECIES: hypothetical protein [Companilactobacillus]KRK78992.1 hypothetical protein FD03_GL001353 [Companilactobacillus nodensis DSM 19682 = JCM 14932 = NBRC 107160]